VRQYELDVHRSFVHKATIPIIFESPDLATDYMKYWNRLKDDTEVADDAGKSVADIAKNLQGKDLRDSDKKRNNAHPLVDNKGNTAGDAHVWFSPNTTQKAVPRGKTKKGATPKVPPSPPDLAEVFDQIDNAKQGVLFLAFIPGSPSVVHPAETGLRCKESEEGAFLSARRGDFSRRSWPFSSESLSSLRHIGCNR
jgi:hypothetical protein